MKSRSGRTAMGRLATVTIPVAVIMAYRLIPARLRRVLSPPPGTSGHALEAVRAGGGWTAFWHDALPQRSVHGGPFDWEHYKSG